MYRNDFIYQINMLKNAEKEEQIFFKMRDEIVDDEAKEVKGSLLQDTSSKLHFTNLSIAQIDDIHSLETLVDILQANALAGLPRSCIEEATSAVWFAKCLWLHETTYDEHLCGFCRKVVYEGQKRCSQCQFYHYCSPECQRAHWKVHKPFCSMLRERKEEQKYMCDHALADLFEERQWDGKHNTHFKTFTRVYEPLIRNAGLKGPDAFLALPSNITSAYGPNTFLDFVDYVIEQCETPFLRERKTWLGVLASYFDSYPRAGACCGHMKRMLRLNAQVFLGEESRLDKLFSVILKDTELQVYQETTMVLCNLVKHGNKGISGSLPSRDVVAHQVHSAFGNLPVDAHMSILRFLQPVDVLQYGRSCKFTASIVSHQISTLAEALSQTPSVFLEEKVISTETLFNGFFEDVKDIEELVEAGPDDISDYETVLISKIRCNELLAKVAGAKRKLVREFRALCCNLQTYKLMTGTFFCPYTKLLLYSFGAYCYDFQGKWADRAHQLAMLLEATQIQVPRRIVGILEDE